MKYESQIVLPLNHDVEELTEELKLIVNTREVIADIVTSGETHQTVNITIEGETILVYEAMLFLEEILDNIYYSDPQNQKERTMDTEDLGNFIEA